jgi:hypothetical protein
MAIFSLFIPDDSVYRITTAVCRSNGYGPLDADDAVEFTRQYVFKHLARVAIEFEAAAAASAAASAVRADPTDPLAVALQTPPNPSPDNGDGATGPAGPTGPI